MQVPLNVSPRAASLLDYNTTYLKALYRGYTDDTFTTYSEQPAWQGTQGPTIRSEVGDLVEIMFVNKLSKAYATMHSMGLQYSKTSEGSDYPNVTRPGYDETLNTGNAVPPVEAGIGPGNCAVYKWIVPDIAGPNGDEPARTHSYHSYVDLSTDTNSGLIGPQIVYARNQMNSTMSTYREFPLLFMGYDETQSVLSGENSKKLTPNHTAPSSSSTFDIPTDMMSLYAANSSILLPQITNLGLTGRFSSAPQFFTLNGYFFANNPVFETCLQDKVIWYVNAFGGESHVFHLHGHSVMQNGKKTFGVDVNDGAGHTLYMDASSEGLWQVICHVNDHHQQGMVGNYRVYGSGEACPL